MKTFKTKNKQIQEERAREIAHIVKECFEKLKEEELKNQIIIPKPEKINATARELCDRTVPCEVCILNEKGCYCTSRNYAKKIIKLGYRKVGKDEQVVKKDQLIEMLNSNLESGKRMGYAQGREETAREIIAIIIDDDGADLNKIAQKYGIELE